MELPFLFVEQPEKELNLEVEKITPDRRIIHGGGNLDLKRAVLIAFPTATNYESFGFKKIGDDLQIKKLHIL